MTIPELRAMLEVLTDEDFRAVLPLERCNSSYVRLMEDRRLLREGLAKIHSMAVPTITDTGHAGIAKICEELLK